MNPIRQENEGRGKGERNRPNFLRPIGLENDHLCHLEKALRLCVFLLLFFRPLFCSLFLLFLKFSSPVRMPLRRVSWQVMFIARTGFAYIALRNINGKVGSVLDRARMGVTFSVYLSRSRVSRSINYRLVYRESAILPHPTTLPRDIVSAG